MRIGELIRYYRLSKGLTLEEVAKGCGVSKVSVLKWENGETKNIRRDKIAKLAAVLNISPIILVTGELPTNDGSISTTDFIQQISLLLERVNELDQSDKQQIITYVRMIIDYKEIKKDASNQ